MILECQRQKLADLYIHVDAHNAPEPPYQFTDIHLHYVLEGSDLDAKKVERAIHLSEEKYCSVPVLPSPGHSLVIQLHDIIVRAFTIMRKRDLIMETA